MNRILPFSLILVLLLTACASTGTTDNPRQATFTLLLNDVQARLNSQADLEPAALGQSLQVGGQAQSGDDSRARLDLLPEGTIVRIGPNTLFTLEELGDDTDNPSTKLRLDFGQIWIILNGGNLEVESEYGNAAVRGSYMSVEISPETGLTVTCLEGHCDLSNDAGTVNLTGGQTSNIPEPGQPPAEPSEMDDQSIEDWQAASPEAEELLNPTPEETTPRTTENGEPIPEKADKLNTQPLQFTLSNNCPADTMSGDWVWQFERLPDDNGAGFVERVNIPNGQTVSGSLPAGEYIVTDWFPNGQQHGPQVTNSDQVSLSVQSCPDGGGNPVNPPPGNDPQPLNPSPTPR